MPLNDAAIADQFDHRNGILPDDADVDLTIGGKGNIGPHGMTVERCFQLNAIAGGGISSTCLQRLEQRFPR